MSSINLEKYFNNPDVNFNNVEINENKPPIELLLPSFILYLANEPENATNTQLIYHLDSHTFSGSKITNKNIFERNFEENSLFFDIGDKKKIEINSTFQKTTDLVDKLVEVINSDIQIKEDYNPEQEKKLYHIINCKRLLYALTKYNEIRSSNDEKNENRLNLEQPLGSSLGKALTNPSDKLPSDENPSNKSLQNSLKKGLEETLTIQNSIQKTGGSLINELDYQLHTTMYILKMIKLLVYRHVFFKQYELVNKDYLIEVFVNVCLFFIFTNGDIDHMVCYIIDQIAVMTAIFTYIRVCEKENWTVDINIISGIILSPVYLVVC